MARRRSRGRSREPAAATATGPAEPTWRRIDLHIHTPGSADYQEPHATYLDILQKAEARGLDIIAFTDHNTVAGYAAMRREVERLEFLEAGGRLMPDEARRLAEYRRLLGKILVLPGFEFTATFGFHILGIFPPQTSVRKLEHLLLELNVPEEKLDLGTSEVGATSDVLRAYAVIAEAGGLVIGAHANSTHGIAMIGLGFGGQTRIAYTQDPNLHALEVTDLESASRRTTARFFNGSKPEYPRRMHCIQGSDAHRVTRDPQAPEKNLGVGDRCTEVLLAEVSFGALMALFTSTDFGRARPYRPSEDPFDPLKAARAEGNTIVQAFHETPGPPGWQRAPLKGLLKDVVAFANTNGGVLYLGVGADPDAPIRGVDNAAEVARQLHADAARLIVPPLQPDVETLASEGKTVLVITVPRGTDTPYALDPGYIYVRQEGETTLALRDEIVQLVRAALAPNSVGLDPALALPTQPAQLPPPAQLAPWFPAPPPAGQGPNGTAPVAQPAAQAAQAAQVAQVAQAAQGRQAVDRQVAQQAAVQQATAAERERQQERSPVPRTGVELLAATERDGVLYHTVRDLRSRRAIRNVTRASARRLWRYAIIQAEERPVRPEEVRWDERDPRFGFWTGFRQSDGTRRYNLIYRERASAGEEADGQGERLRVFYGVTEDGIDDRWRGVLPPDGELPEVHYDDAPAARPADAAQPAPPSPEPAGADRDGLQAPPLVDQALPLAAAIDRPSLDTAADSETGAPVESPKPPRRRRSRQRAPQPSAPETPPSDERTATAPAAPTVEPDLAPAPPADVDRPAVEAPAPPARRRSPHRARPTAESPGDSSGATAQVEVAQAAPEPSVADPAAPDPGPVAAGTDTPPKPPPRRRRGPRKAVEADAQPGAPVPPAPPGN